MYLVELKPVAEKLLESMTDVLIVPSGIETIVILQKLKMSNSVLIVPSGIETFIKPTQSIFWEWY